MKKRSLVLLAVALLCLAANVYSQNPTRQQLTPIIHRGIEKCYAASVRMYSFDTSSNQQTNAPFSGVVVTKDGYILTAAHVVTPGATYKVIFSSGRECIAVGLGKIELAEERIRPDVAMMKILTGNDYPYAEIGRSGALQLQEPCISLSYPESMFTTMPIVRFGYISNLKNDKGFVQSTCIMEPGDSGGPLFDCFGRVIALHSAIDVREDINYEVPVDLYLKYWTALTTNPKVYTNFPTADSVSKDTQVAAIAAIRGIKNLQGNIGTAYKNTSVLVRSAHHGKAVGALFALDNHKCVIVSKSSLVHGDSILISAGGQQVSATVIRRDQQNDLVLLQPASEITGGIVFKKLPADTLQGVQAGQFLVSPQPDTAGTGSIAGNVPYRLDKHYSMAFLGGVIDYRSTPFVLTYVQAHSPASENGLQAGDEIISINGMALTRAEDYGQILTQRWPGDTVIVQIKRGGVSDTKSIVLAVRAAPGSDHPAEKFAGGRSSICDGFAEKVFSHDAVLTPEKIGGPVFDLDGHFRGINIARHSRASCLAMPGAVVYRFIQQSL